MGTNDVARLLVGRRRVLGAAAGGLLAVGGAIVVPLRDEAAQSASGTFTVGTTPVTLTQPAAGGLGRLKPAANADVQGMFGPQVAWPLIPIHAVLTPTGRLVAYGSPVAVARQGGVSYDQWNPAAGFGTGSHLQTPSMTTYNAFCNSLETLPDGRIVMVGGNSDDKTSMSTMLYDPASAKTEMGQPLNRQRWYATTMRLPDDRILVLGGGNYYNTGAYNNPDDSSGVATTPEIGSGSGAWSLLQGATSTTAFGAAGNHWWYPRSFNAPDGKVFGVSGDQMWRLDPSGNGTTSMLGTLPSSIGVSGAAVMYAPGKLLLAGGGQNFNEDNITATNAATTIDITGTTPAAASVTPMANRRNWLNLTVLPTGEVLANGGTVVGTQAGANNSSYAAEIWNPATRAWRTGASAQRIRTYHSTAVLMPNGAVFTGGGGVPGPEDNFNAEMYYPPYLFAKNADGTVGWASRPTVTSIAGSLVWGGSLTLGLNDARTIAAVSLISAAQETHSVNQDQRRIPLAFTQNGGSLSAAVPNNRNTLPPGTYLLSVVDAKGVPSPAQMVTVRNGGAGSVTVYDADASTAEPTTGSNTDAGTVSPTIGSTVGIQPVNYPGDLVRHQNFAARIDPITANSGAVDRNDASFVVRRGLASATGISWEALNYPGYFLVVQNGAVKLAKNDGSAGFAGNATFVVMKGLTGQNTSFQVFGDPSLLLRHQNFVLLAQRNDGSDGFAKDATFSVRAPLGDNAPDLGLLAVGSRASLQPTNYPGYLVRHYQFRARLDKIDGASDQVTKADASFTVREGLGARQGVSFEASSYPGYYLVNDAGAIYLRAADGSAGFAGNATFLPQQGLGGNGSSFAGYADPSLYLRHQNFQLWAQKNDGSAQFGRDATFAAVGGVG